MKTPTKPRKKRQVAHVDLGPLKAQWTTWCKSQGLTQSQAVRRLIEEATADNNRVPSTVAERQGTPKESTKRMELRLTESEARHVKAHAQAAGCRPQRWLIALIRSKLTSAPPVVGPERETLAESNYQLMAIGRNLNQIAHRMNTDPGRYGVQAQQLTKLEKLIRDHIGQARTVLGRGTERWKLQ